MMRMLRCALSALLLAGSVLPALAGSTLGAPEGLPTLEQYPLRDRFFGSGGAFFPNDSMPSEYGLGYMIAAGPALGGGVVKGAKSGVPIADAIARIRQAIDTKAQV